MNIKFPKANLQKAINVLQKVSQNKTSQLLLSQSTASKWWKTTILNHKNQKNTVSTFGTVFLLSSYLS